MIPDWISWGTPFLSGGVGVYVGLKVGIARLEERYSALKDKVNDQQAILSHQVGEARCKEYRENCQEGIFKSLTSIEGKIDGMRTDIVNLAVKTAKIEKQVE